MIILWILCGLFVVISAILAVKLFLENKDLDELSLEFKNITYSDMWLLRVVGARR